jgi:hypothetical protein
MLEQKMKLLVNLIITLSCLILIKTQNIKQEKNLLFSSASFLASITTNSTCQEVDTCMKLDANAVKERCDAIVNKCDSTCMEESSSFETCIGQCNCKTTTVAFPWGCLDNCKAGIKNSNFTAIIDCLYQPCRPDAPSSSYAGIIILIVVLIAAALGTAGFFFYKWRARKNTPSLNMSDGNNFTKLNP